MAAPANLPQSSRRTQNIVLTVTGYGARLHVERGHLCIYDRGLAGSGEWRLTRVAHGVRRIVFITPDATLTIPALEWCAAQDISVVVLERDGELFCATGRQGTSDARLRRAQACLPRPVALRIAKELIQRKLEGQERNARELLQDKSLADLIAAHRLALYRKADNLMRVRDIEARAAKAYWSRFASESVAWERSDAAKIPAHWRVWGSRISPISVYCPRAAVTPAMACLNYLYTVLQSETTIALHTLGLEIGFGILHVDDRLRPSLSLDIMEPVRPVVDAWVWRFLREPQERRWYFEKADGNTRLMAELCSRLAQTAPKWARAVAPMGEMVMEEVWKTCSRQVRKPSTRLTQSARRESKQAVG